MVQRRSETKHKRVSGAKGLIDRPKAASPFILGKTCCSKRASCQRKLQAGVPVTELAAIWGGLRLGMACKPYDGGCSLSRRGCLEWI